VKIVYSFNKSGYEADCWEREIRGASDRDVLFIPFNHDPYLDPYLYSDSVKLDRLYQARDARLMRMYQDFEGCIRDQAADAVIVTNSPPYHPDFLCKIDVYKVLYSGDDPGATYMRNIPYLHAYDHVLFMSPSYSPDMTLEEKMRYCGMVNADWLPIAVFDFEFDTNKTADTILAHERDIDIIYIGSFFRQKLGLIAKVKKAFGRRAQIHGFFKPKHNFYFITRYRYPGWVTPVGVQERVRLYQRAKIGFNIHWNEHGFGNQRLFHLPANGVMQISDCADYHDRVFEPGREIVAYLGADDLIDKLKYYVGHDEERERIARRAFRRAMSEYRFRTVTRRAGELIRKGLERGPRRDILGVRKGCC
jgi:spore maturation protein CgeB